jgi:hypothetical protein
MAEIIKFSDEDRNKTLATPEARQFLIDGVINPDSEDWQKLPKEKQIEILKECGKLSDATRQLCVDLKTEIEQPEEPDASTGDINQKQASEKSNTPANIKSLANIARTQVKATFGNVTDKDYASHMSNMRALLIKMVP